MFLFHLTTQNATSCRYRARFLVFSPMSVNPGSLLGGPFISIILALYFYTTGYIQFLRTKSELAHCYKHAINCIAHFKHCWGCLLKDLCVCVFNVQNIQQQMCRGQRTASGFGLHSPPHLRQDLFAVCRCAVPARLAGLQGVSCHHFPSPCSLALYGFWGI